MEVQSSFSERLAKSIKIKKSAVCVGLDPRWSQLPDVLRQDSGDLLARANCYRTFCYGVMDAVAAHVAVVKPQAAFFEQLGPTGMMVLADVIAYASRLDLIVILDGKRNDIGTTAEAYADAYLGSQGKSVWGADALTVSPYLGDDSLEPFVHVCGQRQAGLFVLVKTSNPGSGFLQDTKSDGRTIYERVAAHVESCNVLNRDANGYGPIGAVVGATYREQLTDLRAKMPSAWILIPGFGAQGGGAKDVAPGFDDHGLGAIVNNSRNIIFAHQRKEYAGRFGPHQWQEAVAAATIEMNEQLRGETSMGRIR